MCHYDHIMISIIRVPMYQNDPEILNFHPKLQFMYWQQGYNYNQNSEWLWFLHCDKV